MSESKKLPRVAPGLRVVKVTVKTLKRKEQFEVAESMRVQDFKALISERFQTPTEQLSLIFAGGILQDQETLAQHKVEDGAKIHLFIKSQRRPPATGGAPCPASEPSLDLSEWHGQPEELMAACHELVGQTLEALLLHCLSLRLDAPTLNGSPLLLGFLLGVTGMSVLGLSPLDASDLASEGMEPEATRQELIGEVMRHPFVQNLFGDTEQVRQMIMSVPQVQQLAEQNPEISHILNNAEFLREMIDVATSPAVMDEIIRNHDRALSNLESIPGGYSALQQLYHDIEAPMLNAVQAQFQGNPFAPPEGKPPSAGTRATPARLENREPLPNPWAAQTPNSSSSGGDSLGRAAAEANDPPGNGQPGYILLTLGPGGIRPAPYRSESIQGLIQQLTENLDFMQRLSGALAQPDGPTQGLLSPCRPFAPPPPPLREGRAALPTAPGWAPPPPPLARSEVAALLGNPRAVQALLQLQTSLLTLSREAPDFLQALADPDVEPESMEDSDEGESPSSSSSSSDAGSLLSANESLELESGEDEQMEQRPPPPPPPREEEGEEEEAAGAAGAALYRGQLAQLRALGFHDQERNLRALRDTDGDLGAAVEKLRDPRAS